MQENAAEPILGATEELMQELLERNGARGRATS